MPFISRIAPRGRGVTREQVAGLVSQACPPKDYSGKKVLLIVPDGTRTAPVGLVFQCLHRQIAEATKAFDVLIALGTHQPMSESAICQRLEISESQRLIGFEVILGVCLPTARMSTGWELMRMESKRLAPGSRWQPS